MEKNLRAGEDLHRLAGTRGAEKDRPFLVSGAFHTDDAFRLMVESVADYALFTLDPQGCIATWNRGAERVKRYRSEEIMGRHFSIFYPGESLEDGLPERALSMAAANGRYEDEGWRIRKGGARFWASVVITALRDRQGQLVGFGKVTRDLSERRRAEQGLAAAYSQVNSVLECTSDGVIKVDRNWTLVYGNRKAADLFADFFVGKNYWDCFPEVQGNRLEQGLRRSMQDRREASYETYYAPYKTWYRGNVYPTHDGLTIFFTDITAEKTMQEERERARMLEEKQLEALSQAPEEVRRARETIVKTSDREIRISHGLRGFGRDSGNDAMETASLYEIVDQCLELQGPRFEHHEVDLRTDLKLDLPYLQCRQTQITQIITHLLDNAFDSVVVGNGEQRWVTIAADCDNDQIAVDVTDSGPGIGDAVKARLMEPFSTTKALGTDMGIGLSLSWAIAQDHGGTLTLCQDTPHTCFRLVLPIQSTAAVGCQY